MHAMAHEVVAQIHTTLGFPRVSIYLLSRSQLVLQAQVGYTQLRPRIAPDEEPIGTVVRTGTPHVAMTAEQTQTITVALRRRNGVPFGILQVETVAYQTRTDDDLTLLDLLASYIGVFIDTTILSTQLRTAERELAAERDLFTRGPVVLVRWSGKPDYRLLYASVNIAQWGYDAATLIRNRLPFFQFVADDDAQRVTDEVHAYRMQGQDAYEQRYRIRTADGALRWIDDLTVVRRDAANIETHYDAYLIDVTHQIAAEEAKADLSRQLHAAQKLESLGRLAAGVAHDFNNLLGVIVGNASIINLIRPDDAELRDSVEQIRTASRRATELTQQILTFAGRGRFRPELLQLNAVVEEAAGLCRTMLARTIQIDLQLAEDLPVVLGDATQIHQIIMNLIVNAGDALSTQPGTIALTTRRIFVSYHPTLAQDYYVELVVHDTGIGMDASTRERVFEPFFTTKPTGNGLGLAAVRGIVQQHHGHINVQSTVGVGTTFTLLLPEHAARPEQTDTPTGNVVTPTISVSGHALVVDDHPAMRATVAALLMRFGYTVIEAADGTAAIAQITAHAALLALLVLDISLPDISGVEVHAQARVLAPQLPIILMSGYTTIDIAALLDTDTRTHFLAKPFTPDQLAQTISALEMRGSAASD